MQPNNLSNRTKNTVFVETNDVNNSAKCQLFPPKVSIDLKWEKWK